jgi:hypothetical protein
MRSGDSPLQMVIALLEDGISEEALPFALAAQAPVAGLFDADLNFPVAD